MAGKCIKYFTTLPSNHQGLAGSHYLSVLRYSCMTTYTFYVIGARDFLLISCSREVDTIQHRDTPSDL